MAGIRRSYGRRWLENVHLYGTHTVDIEGELAVLDANGYRPLRESIAASGTAG